MKSPKDIMYRVIFLTLGSAFLICGFVGIERGHIPAGHRASYREAYATKDPVAFWYTVSLFLLAGGFLVFAGIRGPAVRRTPRKTHKRERDEATHLGITVTDVERDLPEFGPRNKSCELVRGACVRYSLPRLGAGTRSEWSLIQRTEHDGAQLPNGYLLKGDVSDALRKVLADLAAEFSEEYFEFEGTATDVAVYWEEWGGASEVRHVQEVLKRLAAL